VASPGRLAASPRWRRHRLETRTTTHASRKVQNGECRVRYVDASAGADEAEDALLCFVHVHEGAGTSTLRWKGGTETLLVNAAIMGGQGDPVDKSTNMSTVVGLDVLKGK
jgi:hypothetical protein